MSLNEMQHSQAYVYGNLGFGKWEVEVEVTGVSRVAIDIFLTMLCAFHQIAPHHLQRHQSSLKLSGSVL
jgi:hypothetical protein